MRGFSRYQRNISRVKGLTFYPGILHEDEEWVPRVFFNTQRIGFNNSLLYQNRTERAGSITATKNIKRIQDKLLIIDLLNKEFNSDKGYSKDRLDVITDRCASILFGIIIDLSEYKNTDDVIRAIKKKIDILRITKKKKYRIAYYTALIIGIRNTSKDSEAHLRNENLIGVKDNKEDEISKYKMDNSVKSREKQLYKNTGIIAIGTICSKAFQFFLLPLYTNVLSTSEYGVVDVLTTIASLIIPIITLQLSGSVFRFIIDEKDDDNVSKIITSGLFVESGMCILSAIVILVINAIHPIHYVMWFILFIITSVWSDYIQNTIEVLEIIFYFPN